MEKKTQIFFIHGGTVFKRESDYLNYLKTRNISSQEKKRWNQEYLSYELGKYFDIISPRMPLRENAKYEEWKINFERFFILLEDNVILIGYSLGGIFLAKYLSENKFPKYILSVFLIAPPFGEGLSDHLMYGGFILGKELSKLDSCSKNLYLLFSEDDDIVPIVNRDAYEEKLNNAKFFTYNDKNGHFRVEKFPEIINMIKNDVNVLKRT